MVTPAIPDLHRFMLHPPSPTRSAGADQQRPLRRSCGPCSNCLRGGTNHVDDELGLGELGTWLLSTSEVGAPMRFAKKRCRSGWTVRSLVATMYQVGFDFQAVPSTFASNRSTAGGKWVAQTSFFSCSDKSPAKHSTPCGSIQIRPSATSMWEKTSVSGKLVCYVRDVSPASGASAAM